MRARLEAWLGVTLAHGPTVASDSETVVYLSNEGGYPQPWTVPIHGGPARRWLDTPDRIGAVLAAPLRPELLLLRDRGGDEHWQIDRGELGRPVIEPRGDDPRLVHAAAIWASDGESVLFTSNARDQRFFDLYRRARSGPAPARRILQEDAWLTPVEARGERILLARHRTELDTDLLLGDGEDWTLLNPRTEEQTVGSATIGADGVYAAANPHRERAALIRYRPGRSAPEFVREYDGEVEIVRASPEGSALVVVVNRDGWSETYLYTPSTTEERPLRSGPRGVIGQVAWCPDGTGFVYDLSHAEGQDIYYRAIATGKERRLTRPLRSAPARPVAPKLDGFTASDGIRIPFWEYRPHGPEPRGTLLHVHGGPESQARPGFSPVIQFLAAEGWRVVAPNVRGSTGYGRTYVHLDDVGRRPDAVRDLAELVGALRRSGRAEPDRIAIAGGSYGGYMVLAALTSYPDLFAAGIDLVGISNFLTFLERTGPWRRRIREAEYGSLETDRDLLRAISPIFRADRIRAPLLVVHGRNDPRVPFSEAEQIVETLRRLGRTVELLEYADEGHGLHRREHLLESWTRAAEFLEAHLPRAPTGRDGSPSRGV